MEHLKLLGKLLVIIVITGCANKDENLQMGDDSIDSIEVESFLHFTIQRFDRWIVTHLKKDRIVESNKKADGFNFSSLEPLNRSKDIDKCDYWVISYSANDIVIEVRHYSNSFNNYKFEVEYFGEFSILHATWFANDRDHLKIERNIPGFFFVNHTNNSQYFVSENTYSLNNDIFVIESVMSLDSELNVINMEVFSTYNDDIGRNVYSRIYKGDSLLLEASKPNENRVISKNTTLSDIFIGVDKISSEGFIFDTLEYSRNYLLLPQWNTEKHFRSRFNEFNVFGR